MTFLIDAVKAGLLAIACAAAVVATILFSLGALY